MHVLNLCMYFQEHVQNDICLGGWVCVSVREHNKARYHFLPAFPMLELSVVLFRFLLF